MSIWNEAAKSHATIGPAPVDTLVILEVNFTSTEPNINGFDVQVDFDGTRLQATGAGGRSDSSQFFLGDGADLCPNNEPVASGCIFGSATQAVAPSTNAITANSVRLGMSTLDPYFLTDEGTLFRIRFRVQVASGFSLITINHSVSSVAGSARVGFCEVNGLFSNDGVNRQPPVLAPIGSRTLNEETMLSFTATATDPEGGPVTFCAAYGNAAGASMTPAGAFTWTPSEAQGPGSYRVVVFASDITFLVTEEAITVTVNEVNLAPVMFGLRILTPPPRPVPLPGFNATVDWNQVLSFTLSASDADVPIQTLTYSMIGGPPGATMDPFGEFLWPETSRPQGSVTFTVRVTDGIAADTAPVRVCILFQGDVNDDGVVNFLDLGQVGAAFLKSAGQTGFNPAADVNKDNVINFLDLGVIGTQFLRSC